MGSGLDPGALYRGIAEGQKLRVSQGFYRSHGARDYYVEQASVQRTRRRLLEDYFSPYLRSYAGNQRQQFEATTDLLKSTVYPPDMVFSGQEEEGYIVFPVLHKDVSNFTVNVPDMAVRFDYKGEPVETIDLAFKFQREIYYALHPRAETP